MAFHSFLLWEGSSFYYTLKYYIYLNSPECSFTMEFYIFIFSISITYFYQLMANACFLSSSYNKNMYKYFPSITFCISFLWVIPAALACQWQFCASSHTLNDNLSMKNHTHKAIGLKDIGLSNRKIYIN